VDFQVRRGAPAARNAGIRAAKGMYMAFLDDDDRWLPEKLQRQIDVFASCPEDVGVVYTAFWREKNGRRTYVPSKRIKGKDGDIHETLLNGNFVTVQAAMVKRECFDKADYSMKSFPDCRTGSSLSGFPGISVSNA